MAAGLLEPGDQRLEEYWAERYDTNEVPGINYRELQDLELHEVADFTRDMHPLDVGEAVSHPPFQTSSFSDIDHLLEGHVTGCP